MPLVLPYPSGILRTHLLEALALAPEEYRDELVVNIVSTLEDLGFSIEGNGWLDDDEALQLAVLGEGSGDEDEGYSL